MRVLLLGAGGFIGAHIAVALQDAGHDVRAAVRSPASARRRLAACEVVAADLLTLGAPESWRPYLQDVDAVVNAAGLLQADSETMEMVHHRAPAALFEACRTAGISTVIHISAIGADPEAGTVYADSKRRGEDALRRTDLDWVVLRPSVVWSPVGSYGGTSALRGLAALPWAVPVIGRGDQAFTPITAGDLARSVVTLLSPEAPRRVTLSPCGPETLSMKELLRRLRHWLGLPPARIVEIPMALMRMVCRIGDIVGSGPVTTTSLRQLEHGTAADSAAFSSVIGFEPTGMDAALARHPAQQQDLWHARLYFLEPALRFSLVLLWLGSGIAGLLSTPAEIDALIGPMGLPQPVTMAAAIAASCLDLAIAAALLIGWRPALVGLVQIATITGYTLLLTLLRPDLWLAPLGPLLKNLPILAAVAAHMALVRGR